MTAPAFNLDFEPDYGRCVNVSPMLRRVVAENPSKFTFRGTGTYIVGSQEIAIVDPGPDDAAHVDAVLRAVRNETVSHVLITHTHADHSPAARAVAAATGAQVVAFGPHPADAVGESPEPENGDEPPTNVDTDFTPDETIAHGETVEGRGWAVTALHTPGHISNHLCFALHEEPALLTGDHVMGWSTTVIPPPDGDIGAYLRSLQLVIDHLDESSSTPTLYPTHGGPVVEPLDYVAALHDHRLTREQQIVEQLALGPRTAEEIVAVLYADVREELHRPAARSVLAHLRKLRDDARAITPDAPDADPLDTDTTRWHLTR